MMPETVPFMAAASHAETAAGGMDLDGRGSVTGRVHSVQSLGAVDGPGLRSVVFLQGCPLRCVYCHNPDTWEFNGGTKTEAGQLVKKLLRFKLYWGKDGGVTVSGGEPLAQPEFVEEIFGRLHEAGVHTALDTSGTGSLCAAERVLRETDLALVDLKFLSEEEYHIFCQGSFHKTEEFLDLTVKMKVPVWIRHVAVPGLTADEEYMKAVKEWARGLPNLQKLEFLPFHNLCIEKYDRLGIPFPLRETKVMEEKEWKKLLEKIQQN